MKFVVFTDGSANLPKSLLGIIRLLPCNYALDGEQYEYNGDIDDFDSKTYYNGLRDGKEVKTTLLNTELFIEYFEPVLKENMDVIYVSMSSGISGTFNAARLAKEELEEKYPDRTICVVDSLGCGFGSGLLAYKAAHYSIQNMETKEAENKLNDEVKHICQYFTVDDLNFLKKTGRVSGVTADIATILNIKPILYGNAEGKIVGCNKVKGRKAAINALVDIYKEKMTDCQNWPVCISHGDCADDAYKLADKIREISNPSNIIITQHEPFSGAHVGPGMLGLFFYGKER